MRADVHVVSAEQAAALDESVIGAGVPSRALMQRAGAAAAAEIARRFGRRLARGVAIYAGPGNNGGDGWVVAGALGAAGIAVGGVMGCAPRTEEARAEREAALPFVESAGPSGAEEVVVDGLLGTGRKGALREDIVGAVASIAERRARGAAVVALDVPTGVDATTGQATDSVRADLTLTFGTMKRGLLVARGAAGRIAVLDIGLGVRATVDDTPLLADARWALSRVPGIAAEAHKGTRGKLAIVGGSAGMAGAAVLAARAALRSGAGLVKVVVAPESLSAVQSAVPQALAATWPESGAKRSRGASVGEWADALLLGPGLGRSDEARQLVEELLREFRGPVVVDADALNLYAAGAGALGGLLDRRPALVTPHPAEFARLAGTTVQEVLDGRFDVGRPLARALRATVLLKGVPTIVTDQAGRQVVSGAGTPALATGGSGDLLAGIAAALLMQTRDPLAAGACAAWVHGRAAELATARLSGGVRGVSLDDIEGALASAWRLQPGDLPRYPVLAELPGVGDSGGLA